MAYQITLSSNEMTDLAFFADRGYDCGLYEAVLNAAPEGEHSWNYHCDAVTVELAEHVVWDIAESSEFHGAWACLDWNSALGGKIAELLGSVV